MESILSKPSENEALEIWKKFTEQPGLYIALGLAPFVNMGSTSLKRLRHWSHPLHAAQRIVGRR